MSGEGTTSRDDASSAIANEHAPTCAVELPMRPRFDAPVAPWSTCTTVARMGLRLGWVAAFALVASISTGASAQIGDLRRPLDQAERRTLARGEIVTRPATERRGALNLFGGLSYIVVDLPVEAVWRALNDDSSYYRRMLPQVERAVEQERHGERSRVIRFHHSVGPIDAAYSVRFQFDAANKTRALPIGRLAAPRHPLRLRLLSDPGAEPRHDPRLVRRDDRRGRRAPQRLAAVHPPRVGPEDPLDLQALPGGLRSKSLRPRLSAYGLDPQRQQRGRTRAGRAPRAAPSCSSP